MDSCVKKAVAGKEFNHRGQGLFVSLKLLKGDVKQVMYASYNTLSC